MNTITDGHPKSKILVKPKMVREPYFDDSRFSRSDIELLFSLRTRMLDLKGNFSNKYGLDIACRVFKVQVECKECILKCEVLKENVDVVMWSLKTYSGMLIYNWRLSLSNSSRISFNP